VVDVVDSKFQYSGNREKKEIIGNLGCFSDDIIIIIIIISSISFISSSIPSSAAAASHSSSSSHITDISLPHPLSHLSISPPPADPFAAPLPFLEDEVPVV